MNEPCRVSFVVSTRNDDFGGDMLRRLGLFVDNLTFLADRHALDAEIVVVEWNPPQGPRLRDVLSPRHASPHVLLRYIEVPPAFHRSLPNAGMLPLFQMIAKNVGIQRARGDFVVATNQDLLFSDALIRRLARGPLRADRMHRIDRTDVDAAVPDDAPVDEQLAWAGGHVLRVHRRFGTMESMRVAGLGRVARGHARRMLRSVLSRPPFGWLLDRLRPMPPLHTNACGDFTMLPREGWKRLRGYPELPLYSLHIDSFLCMVAVAAGFEEEVLRAPCRLYHLEHESSWAVLDPEQRIEWFGRKPWLEYRLLEELWQHMKDTGRIYLYNDENWGFGKETFPETCIRNGVPVPAAAPHGGHPSA